MKEINFKLYFGEIITANRREKVRLCTPYNESNPNRFYDYDNHVTYKKEDIANLLPINYDESIESLSSSDIYKINKYISENCVQEKRKNDEVPQGSVTIASTNLSLPSIIAKRVKIRKDS